MSYEPNQPQPKPVAVVDLPAVVAEVTAAMPTTQDNWQTWVRFIATTALLLLNLLAQMRPQPVPAAPSVVNVQPATPAAK